MPLLGFGTNQNHKVVFLVQVWPRGVDEPSPWPTEVSLRIASLRKRNYIDSLHWWPATVVERRVGVLTIIVLVVVGHQERFIPLYLERIKVTEGLEIHRVQIDFSQFIVKLFIKIGIFSSFNSFK